MQGEIILVALYGLIPLTATIVTYVVILRDYSGGKK